MSAVVIKHCTDINNSYCIKAQAYIANKDSQQFDSTGLRDDTTELSKKISPLLPPSVNY
jgi:hypothetical protein